MKITVFANEKNPHGKFMDLSEDQVKVVFGKHAVGAKFGQKLWSPAEFSPCKDHCSSPGHGGYTDCKGQRPHRLNANVVAVHSLVLDFDSKQATIDSVTARALLTRVRKHGGLIYTSHSHTPEAFAFRAVVYLSRPVLAAEWARFYPAALAALNLRAAEKGVPGVDRACKDPARGYFAPTKPTEDAASFAMTWGGPPLDVDSVLQSADAPVASPDAPAPLPAPNGLPAGLEGLAVTDNGLPVNLGPRGGPPGQDAALHSLSCHLVFKFQEDSADQIVGRMLPTLMATDWGEGLQHLIVEARKKIDRAVVRREAEKASRREAQEVGMAVALELSPATAPAPTAPSPAPVDPRPEGVATRRSFQDVALQQVDKDGRPKLVRDPVNVGLWLETTWPGAFRLNTVTGAVEIHAPCPLLAPGELKREIRATDDTVIRNVLSRIDGALRWMEGTIAAQVANIAQKNAYDPVKEHLNSLVWDGVPRLKTWLHDYLGVSYVNDVGQDITKYVQGVAEKFLVGLAARGLEPGCQMDYALILEGAQGVKKSSTCRLLGGGFFTEEGDMALGNKDTKQKIGSVLVVELPELSALRRSDIESVKAFITCREDMYRPPYGRYTIRQPRRCVMIGSTNDAEYLQDPTGNRRFWPVKTGKLDLEGFAAVRDQLVAEAVVLHRQGVKPYLSSEVEALAASETDARVALPSGGAWASAILEKWLTHGRPGWFDVRLAAKWVGIDTEDIDMSVTGKVTRELKGLFTRKQRMQDGRRVWVYTPDLSTLALEPPTHTADPVFGDLVPVDPALARA